MKNRFILYCLAILLVISCSKDDSGIDTNPTEADKFLNEVLDLMEKFSINRLKIDWQGFRTKVFDKVSNAQTIQDTYPGVREALILLGDNHSRYDRTDGSSIFVGTIQCGSQNIVEPFLPENIGYIKINSFVGNSNSTSAISFAKEIQNQIITQDSPDIIGWIIDLRGNRGGNMWPMIAGIGPILGEGIAGYIIEPNNKQTSWRFLNGSALRGDDSIIKLSNSYELTVSKPKVAVLLDDGVASSGEAVAVSFIGRENTKSFGTNTCGLSTVNRTLTLSDNSKLILTGAYLADRNKKMYGSTIDPDEVATNENIIPKAIDWLRN